MYYVGMDCHITTLDFAVVNEAGQLIKTKSVATGVRSFIDFAKTVPQPRRGQLAGWTLETCDTKNKEELKDIQLQNRWFRFHIYAGYPKSIKPYSSGRRECFC